MLLGSACRPALPCDAERAGGGTEGEPSHLRALCTLARSAVPACKAVLLIKELASADCIVTMADKAAAHRSPVVSNLPVLHL